MIPAASRLVEAAPRSGAGGPASARGCRRRGRLAGWHWRFASGPLLVVSRVARTTRCPGPAGTRGRTCRRAARRRVRKSSCCMRNTDNKLSVPPCGSSCTPKRRGRSRQRTWVSPARSPRRMALAFRQWAVARSLAGGPDNSLSGSRRDKRPDLSTCCARARAKSSCCMRNTDNKLSVPPCGSSCTPKRRSRSRQRTWVSPARSPRRVALAFRQWAVARSLALARCQCHCAADTGRTIAPRVRSGYYSGA